MSKVLEFTGGKSSAQKVFDEAARYDLEVAVVLGFTSDGDLFAGGTRCDIRDLTLLQHYLGELVSQAIAEANGA